MPARIMISALIVFCEMAAVLPARAQQGVYRQGSLPSDRPQPIYANDPQDSWNRIFYSFFTRTVTLRLTEDFPEGAPFVANNFGIIPGFPALRVSERTFERFESGDRGIDPLYPSFLDSLGTVRLLTEPRYSEFEKALRAALEERNQHPPIARALMQSDLWAAYDMIFRNLRWLDAARSALVLKMLARMIRKLALTQEEIAALPDNYAAGANRLHLPDLFGANSSWIEIEWGQSRLHDSSANDRRSTRVFMNPGPKLTDQRAFLESFRDDHFPYAPLQAVALVTNSLLIDNSGNAVPSSITTEVQVREFNRSSDGRLSKTEIADFELSRKAMLTEPSSGGLVRFDETTPAYLAASGNDYSFAAGIDSSDGRARDISIMVSLRTHCIGCHGKNVANLLTFSKQDPRSGEIRILDKRKDEHAQYVVEQKTKLGSWKSLQEQWLAELSRHILLDR
jgi:hypothetical protein